MYKSIVMPSLNAIAKMLSKILPDYSTSTIFVIAHTRKACNDYTVYVCLTGEGCVTIIPDDIGQYRFWIEVKLSMACHCSKFNPHCLLSCQENSKLKCFICQTTVTLHQGQGH